LAVVQAEGLVTKHGAGILLAMVDLVALTELELLVLEQLDKEIMGV
jgi:hypothetical protein